MRFASPFPQTQKDTRKVKTQTTAQTVEVRADGEGLVSHAGAYLLVELADRLGLTAALSAAMAPTRERRSAHDPGVVLRDLAVAIADGGDRVSDLGVLRGQEALVGGGRFGDDGPPGAEVGRRRSARSDPRRSGEGLGARLGRRRATQGADPRPSLRYRKKRMATERSFDMVA
jgi:hypothetical protein